MGVEENFTNDWVHWVTMGFFVAFTVAFLIYTPLFIYLMRFEPLRSRFPGWALVGGAGGYFVFLISTTALFVNKLTLQTCSLFFVVYTSIPAFVLIPPLIRAFCLWFLLGWNKAKASREASWHSRYAKYLFSTKAQIIFFVLFSLLWYLIYLIVQFVSSHQHGFVFFDGNCAVTPANQLFIPRLFAVICIDGPLLALVLLLWKKNDAFNIRNEIIILLCVHIPAFILFSLRVSTQYSHLFPATFHSRWVYQIVEMVMFVVSIIIPVHAALRERKRQLLFHSDSTISIEAKNLAKKLGSKTRREVLDLVLGSTVLTDAFVDFCERSFCVENILFVIDVLRFRDLTTIEEKKAAAKIIIEHYFLKESPLLLNIDDKVMHHVEDSYNALAQEGAILNNRMFDESYSQVFEQLLRDPFQRWTSLDEFEQALLQMVKLTSSHSSSHPNSHHSNNSDHEHHHHDHSHHEGSKLVNSFHLEKQLKHSPSSNSSSGAHSKALVSSDPGSPVREHGFVHAARRTSNQPGDPNDGSVHSSQPFPEGHHSRLLGGTEEEIEMTRSALS